MDITICIPTLNRPEFLLRELRYYKAVNFRGKIFIGDSSAAAIADKIRNFLRQFDGQLEIHYYHLPGYNIARALKFMADKVTTKYTALIADDDFFIPSGIGRCIEFLDTHPDYIAAQGQSIVIGSPHVNSQSILYSNYCPQPPVFEATAVKRLVAHMNNYSVTLFSVHRAEAWRTMFENAGEIADTTFGAELLPCCLSVVLGKTRQLDGLYLIRQNHENRYLLPHWFKWITSEAWYPGYTAFYHCLAEEVAGQDGLSLEEASDIVSQSFSVYLTHEFSTITPNSSPRWRRIAEKIPGAKAVWHTFQSLHNKKFNKDEYYFGNMIKPESPYYKDFMPIYQMVTQRQVDVI